MNSRAYCEQSGDFLDHSSDACEDGGPSLQFEDGEPARGYGGLSRRFPADAGSLLEVSRPIGHLIRSWDLFIEGSDARAEETLRLERQQHEKRTSLAARIRRAEAETAARGATGVPTWIACSDPGCSRQFLSVAACEAHWLLAHRFVCASCQGLLSSARQLDIHIAETHDAYFAAQMAAAAAAEAGAGVAGMSDEAGERKGDGPGLGRGTLLFECLLDPGDCRRAFASAVERDAHCVEAHLFHSGFRFAAARPAHAPPTGQPLAAAAAAAASALSAATSQDGAAAMGEGAREEEADGDPEERAIVARLARLLARLPASVSFGRRDEGEDGGAGRCV